MVGFSDMNERKGPVYFSGLTPEEDEIDCLEDWASCFIWWLVEAVGFGARLGRALVIVPLTDENEVWNCTTQSDSVVQAASYRATK